MKHIGKIGLLINTQTKAFRLTEIGYEHIDEMQVEVE